MLSETATETICNEHGETLTISRAALLEQVLTLNILQVPDGPLSYRIPFMAHLGRAERLITALDNLAANRDSEEAHDEYRKARRGVEADVIYFLKPETQTT